MCRACATRFFGPATEDPRWHAVHSGDVEMLCDMFVAEADDTLERRAPGFVARNSEQPDLAEDLALPCFRAAAGRTFRGRARPLRMCRLSHTAPADRAGRPGDALQLSAGDQL